MARARNRKGQFAKRRKTRKSKKRSYRRNSPVGADLMLMNPPRRRRRSRRRYASNPRRSRRSYVRRIGKASRSLIPSVSGIMGTVQEGAFLAAGAVIVSQVNARFVPDFLKTGPLKYAVRLGIAFVGGNLVSRFVNPKLGRAVTVGGVMSTVLTAANEYLGGAIAPLGAMEEMALGAYYAEPSAMGTYYTPGMVSTQPDFLGYETDLPARFDSRF